MLVRCGGVSFGVGVPEALGYEKLAASTHGAVKKPA